MPTVDNVPISAVAIADVPVSDVAVEVAMVDRASACLGSVDEAGAKTNCHRRTQSNRQNLSRETRIGKHDALLIAVEFLVD
jgi:hypothetical protein